MSGFFRAEIRPPFRLRGKFTKAEEALLASKREGMRNLGRQITQYMKEEAPQGRTGKFKESHRYTTKIEGDRVSMAATRAEPLGTFISKGTRPHWIAARNARALSFFWPKVGLQVMVPKRGGFKTHVSDSILWIGKGGVNHPGTKANPYEKRAYQRWRPQALIALAKMARDWTEGFVK